MRSSNETEAGHTLKPGSAGRVRGKDSGKRGMSLRIFAPAIVFTVIMLGTLVWFGWYSYHHLKIVENQHLTAVKLIGTITRLDEVLTMSARMCAATGDSEWEQRYEGYEPELDAAIKKLTALAPEAIMSDAVVQTDSANVALVGLERRAFELVREGNLSEATEILCSGEYEEQKRIYSGGMTAFTEALENHMAAELRKHRSQILIAALFVAASASVVLLGWVHMLRERRHVLQRKKTAKTFRASEELLTTFLDSAPSTFVSFDRDLNLTAVKGAGFEMSGGGLTKDEVIGKNIRDFYPGLEETEEYGEYLAAIEKGKTVFLENVCLGPKFGDVHVSVSAFKTLGGLGLIVTNYSEAEQTLLQREAEYRRMLSNIPGMVFRAKSDWSVDFVSNTESVCGWSPEDFYERRVNWRDIVHPEDRDMVLSEGEGLAKKAGSLVQEYRIITKGGDTRWVEDHKTSSAGEDGTPAVIDGIVFDISKRREAEEGARKSRALVHGILEAANVLVTVRDTEGRYLFINKQVEDLLGLKSEEIAGKTPFDVHSKAKAEKILADDNKVIDSGKQLDIEDELEVGGERRVFFGSKFPLLDDAGSLYAVCTAVGDITNYHKAEDALRRSREGMAIAQRVAHVGSWERDLNTGEVIWSDEAFRLLGLEPREVEPNFEVFLSYVHPEDKACVRNAVESIIIGSSSRIEFRVLGGDGVERFLEGQGELISDSNGEPSRILGICQDITERERAVAALRQSEQKYRTLVENLPQKVFLKDSSSTYVSCNESFARDFGIGSEDVVGKSDYDFFPAEVAEKYREDDRRVVESGEMKDVDEAYIVGGRETIVHTVKTPVRDAEGNVTGVLGIFWDIAERKRLEQALSESEEKYRALVENAGETIATLDRDGKYLFMNKTGAVRAGKEVEDYIGKTLWDMFPKDVADSQMAIVRRVIDTGKGDNYIAPTLLQGRVRWYDTTIEPLRDGSGEVTSALVIARDIHEIRQAEMEIDAYGEKMTQAERLASLGTISATLAHELTQPLTVISLSIEDSLTELEGVSCSRAVKEGLRDSLKEVGNVTAIVERFRNFARKSSAKTVNKVKLKVVAERIIKLLSKSAEQATVDLHVKDLEKLPKVYFNEKEMEQLFFALVQNSIQAADGKGRHKLVIDGAVKDEYIELRFEDDCGGVKADDVESIFEPFFTTKAAGEGTGLGLCIVQRVAERSGGHVRVDNRQGEGLTIIVTLGIAEKRTS